MYKINEYDIKNLYWKISDSDELIPAEMNAANELLKLELKFINLDISYIQKSATVIRNVLDVFQNDRYSINLVTSIKNSVYLNDILNYNIKRVTVVIDRADSIKEFMLIAEKLKCHNVILEAMVLVDNNNYLAIEEICSEVKRAGFFSANIHIKRVGNDLLAAEDLLEFIKAFNQMQQYLNMEINILSYEDRIDAICQKGLVDQIYIDEDGYIGACEILPTFTEHISSCDVFDTWSRYIYLYLNQSILFYLNQFGLSLKYKTTQEIAVDCMNQGYLNNCIPSISPRWSLVQKEDMDIHTIENNFNQESIKMNESGFHILQNVDGQKSIYQIMQVVAADYTVTEKSKIFYSVVNYISELNHKKIICLEDMK